MSGRSPSVLRHPGMRALLGARVGGTVATQILSLVVVGLWMWRFPALRRVDRLSDLRPA